MLNWLNKIIFDVYSELKQLEGDVNRIVQYNYSRSISSIITSINKTQS